MKINKKLLGIILGSTLIIGSSAVALASSGVFASKGVVQYDNNSDGTPEIVIDASDLDTIYDEVIDGKTALATEINSSTSGSTKATSLSTSASSPATFAEIKSAITSVKTAGTEKAYSDIAAAYVGTDKESTYSSVKDLATLQAAITADNENSAQAVVDEIKANPKTNKWGITNGISISQLDSYGNGSSGGIDLKFDNNGYSTISFTSLVLMPYSVGNFTISAISPSGETTLFNATHNITSGTSSSYNRQSFTIPDDCTSIRIYSYFNNHSNNLDATCYELYIY